MGNEQTKNFYQTEIISLMRWPGTASARGEDATRYAR